MNPSTDQTVILGGGFTGLFTALHLSQQRYPLPIILIDRKERFIFKPLLYELLSNEMDVDLVWPRYEKLLHNSGVMFIRDTVQAIDLHQRQVKLTSSLRYTYRHLVLALGSTTGYFGVKEREKTPCLSARQKRRSPYGNTCATVSSEQPKSPTPNNGALC